jgi:hypothetical protein
MPSRRMLLSLACALFFLPLPSAAQKLQAGTWTGTMTPPGQQSVDVAYDVAVSGDSTHISIKAQGREVPFTSIKVAADRLTFDFAPGPTIHCTLMLQKDKSYKGDCVDGNGGTGVLVMIPPAKK